MYFNLFQRPDKAHLEMYGFQREVSHKLKLKATVFVRSETLDDKNIIDMCREDYEKYGDELGLWISGDENASSEFLWLNDREDKIRSVHSAIDGFIRNFGFAPKTVGNFILDSELIKIIKDYCPEVTACVAGCFEEGVKVFHGCNNSWYLFSEGMSWNPWYPSKGHSLRPAENENDWSGVVAVPHLCRDLVFGYESRNDFFASHPQNVQRGLANKGAIHEYDFNLCDQYRMQEDFNDGFSYYQIHVSAGWLSHNPNLIDSDEITHQIYTETLAYMKKLCDEGKAEALSFSEFAEKYKKVFPIGKQTVALGKDILTGSGKQYYWVFDSDYRVLVDMFQGGSIGDLRPYASKYSAITGPHAENGRYLFNTYPYLIQSQYRSGFKNHYRDGSRTTLLAVHNGETLDICAFNTKVECVERTEKSSKLTLLPVTLRFADGFFAKIQTEYDFLPEGKIKITRNIIEKSDENAELSLCEYVKASYGFTEYPEDMKNVDLYSEGEKVIDFSYKNQKFTKKGGKNVSAVIPEITSVISLYSENDTDYSEVSEGELFDPFFILKINYKIQNNTKETATWLQLKTTKE